MGKFLMNSEYQAPPHPDPQAFDILSSLAV